MKAANTLVEALQDNASFAHDPQTAQVIAHMPGGHAHSDVGPSCALWSPRGDAGSAERMQILLSVKLEFSITKLLNEHHLSVIFY